MRQIILDQQELRQALEACVGPDDPKLPDGKIASASISSDGQQVTVSVINGTTQEPSPVSLPASRVAAALIKFCMRRRIPMPRGASKYLCVSGDNLGIRVVLKTASVADARG